ncbi:hypothetical protein Mapa_002115 [Marchantia paleacea]|nr:hypothetical protein Mapa_002115 [Marchantia paleacea]
MALYDAAQSILARVTSISIHYHPEVLRHPSAGPSQPRSEVRTHEMLPDVAQEGRRSQMPLRSWTCSCKRELWEMCRHASTGAPLGRRNRALSSKYFVVDLVHRDLERRIAVKKHAEETIEGENVRACSVV